MAFVIKVIIRSGPLDHLIEHAAELDPIIADLVSEDIQAGAKMRAAVDTGFMRDNIDREVNGGRFLVIARADYSGFVEYGTRFMGAQPFMTPAVEAADYDGAAQEALKRIGF
jgi:HK97 gp10 family phage protein